MAKDITSIKLAEIASLPSKYPFWKVNWFGEFSINQITYEPLIDLWMTPLNKNESFNPEEGRLLSGKMYDLKETRPVQIGVGQLPLVSVGSFFENGNLLQRPAYETQIFKFKPNKENQEIIFNSGIKVDDFHLWAQILEFIPPAKSKSLIVKFNKDNHFYEDFMYFTEINEKTKSESDAQINGLVIPCVELIRFYYANSSQMFQQIFTDGLMGEDNRVFKRSLSEMPDPQGRNGFVHLSKWVKNLDAPTVARLAFDPYALRQARHIYISLLNADLVKTGRVPEAYFPFNNQETSLKVHGIPIDTTYGNYFLVFWIESCTAAFPFEEFKFWRENPGWMAHEYAGKDFEGNDSKFSRSDDYSPIDVTINRKRYTSSEVELVSNLPPSVARAELEILLPLNRFPDLTDKPWEPENRNPETDGREEKNNLEVNFYDVSDPMEIGSTAPRDGTKKATKLSIGIIKQESTNETLILGNNPRFKRIVLFREITECINTIDKISGKPIHLSLNPTEVKYEDQPSRFPGVDFNKVAEEKRSEIEKLYQQDVYILELVYLKNDDSHYAYFFDIIPSETTNTANKNSHCYCLLFKAGSFESLSGTEISDVLIECLETNGTWFQTKDNEIERGADGEIKSHKTIPYLKLERSVGDLRMIKIRHQNVEPDYYAKKLTGKFKDAVSSIEKFHSH